MKVQGCDRNCKSCPLLKLCGGIEQYGVKGYRCYQADCWAFDDEHETLGTRREDLMTYVVVHGNGKVELGRWV